MAQVGMYGKDKAGESKHGSPFQKSEINPEPTYSDTSGIQAGVRWLSKFYISTYYS